MRVAFLVWEFPVLSEVFIVNQITGLIDRGHEVDIFALHGSPNNCKKVHTQVEKYRLLESAYLRPSVPKNYIKRSVKGLRLLLEKRNQGSLLCLPLFDVFKYGQLSYSWRLFYQAVPFIKVDNKYDIIHCQFGELGLIGLLFRSLGLIKGKLITSFRGYDISCCIQEKGDHIYDSLFERGDFFLTNCEFFRQRLIKLGCEASKVIVHGSGIDCNKFTFQPRHFPADGKVNAITVGRLKEKKGIKYGIRAIFQLLAVRPNLKIEYYIVGEGSLREQLQQLIDELNLTDKVQLLGWKNHDEIVEILNFGHIFIAPSVTASNGDQDAPVNTLKEAMAMGLPVIATQHGGIPELVEDGISGFLVPERDSDAIADKLGYLIDHSETWLDIGRAGRKQVQQKYDINMLNNELVEIYQKLLSSP